MERPVPVLEYAGPRVDGPEYSRLIREELDGGGVRFTDPPVGWGGVMGNVLVSLFGVGLTIVLAILCFDGIRLLDGWATRVWRVCVPVASAVGTWLVWEEARLKAKMPTVIEASRVVGLRVHWPTLIRGKRSWTTAQLKDVRAGMSRATLRGITVSAVIVMPRRSLLGVRLLENRDAREVRWVVRELRAALGMPPVEY
jgi:hypothetical protein